MHTPEALQASICVHASPSLQLVCCWQFPIPSHFPVLPQAVLDFVQVVVLARGTPPTGIGEQVPNLSFGRMQLSQSPVQALLQHTPSAVH
jgi:hypothetical protein